MTTTAKSKKEAMAEGSGTASVYVAARSPSLPTGEKSFASWHAEGVGPHWSHPFCLVLDSSVFFQLVALFTVNGGVDPCYLVFAGDPEAQCLLDGEPKDQRDNEGVDHDSHRGNCLHRELTEVSTCEEPGVDGKEPEVKGSHQPRDQVDTHYIE